MYAVLFCVLLFISCTGNAQLLYEAMSCCLYFCFRVVSGCKRAVFENMKSSTSTTLRTRTCCFQIAIKQKQRFAVARDANKGVKLNTCQSFRPNAVNFNNYLCLGKAFFFKIFLFKKKANGSSFEFKFKNPF